MVKYTCCGKEPKASYDTHLKKWFLECTNCGVKTGGHSAKKKAEAAWDRMMEVHEKYA